MPKVKEIETPKERLKLAKRLLRNAKEELRKAGVIKEVGFYEDYKYVVSASGLAFRAACFYLEVLMIYFTLAVITGN